jgi:hypothetical protein
MNNTLRICGAAVIVVMVAACGQAAVAPSPATVAPSATAVAPSAAASSSAVRPSAAPSSGPQTAHMTVAGTDVNGPALRLTMQIPADWQASESVAERGTSSPPAGMAFVVSVVDNTFADPCSHRQRSPKVGPTVGDLASALGKVPNTTATVPVKTTIAGHEATYIELAIPASLPCDLDEFYLWQDSPGGYWWAQGLNETARVWILDVGGRRVTFLAHSYAGSGADAKAVFETILNTAKFEGAS